MIVYLFLLSFSLILLVLRNSSLYTNIIYRKFIFLTLLLIMFVLYVFRSVNVGSDYGLYNALFDYPPTALKSFHIESAYIYINSVAQHYNNFLILPAIIFLISFFGMYMLSKKLKLNEFSFLSFFVLTYVYYSLFNVMRQFSALGVICFGLFIYLSLNNHRYIKLIIYILIILFSTLFHNTAIIGLFLILLFKLNLNKIFTTLIILTIPFLFLSRIIDNIANYILVLFPQYINKYSNNISSLISSGYKSNLQLIILIIESIFLLLYLYLANNNQIQNYNIKFILNGYFVFLILAAGSSNMLIGRIETYFYLFQPLFSCIFIDQLDEKYKYFKLMYIILLIMNYIFQLLVIDNGGLVPYSFI